MSEPRQAREWKIWKAALRNGLFFAIFLTGLFVIGRVSGPEELQREVPYSELQQDLAAGRVERIVVSDEDVTAYLKAPDARGAKIVSAERVEPELAQQLSRYNVPFSREHSSNALQQVLAWLAPTLIFVGFWYVMSRGLGRGQGLRRSAPAIIFIDELDALGRARGAYGMGGHDEKSRPSINCWLRWTVLTRRLVSSFSGRPTGRRSWIPRCCGPVVSIARSWWTGPI